MADAAISFAVEKLGDLLIQKVSFLQGVDREVQWLRNELERMQSFLKDATKKQTDNERIRKWISEIRELAQDAEDVSEIFALKVENAASSRGLLGKCACFPAHVSHLNRVGEEIESIKGRLQDIESSRRRYGIQALDEGMVSRRISGEVEQRRRLAYWHKDKDVVGLEKDVDLLLEKAILDDRKGLSVAAIEGMGGIGKSTLARMVYNHAAVADRFELRAWVVVSSEFTPSDIIKQIMLQLHDSTREVPYTTTKKFLEHSKIEKLGKELMLRHHRRHHHHAPKPTKPIDDKLKILETMEKSDLPNLHRMLHQRLQGSRYFIVLDDVWEESHGEALASAFPDEDEGSRLLITSRNRVITKYTRYVHRMKILDLDRSWELFLKKAFIDNTDRKCPEELRNVGKEILKKCNGLPLAISVIGGILMRQKQSKKEWEKVLRGIDSHLGRSGNNVVSAILELSYHNLPPHLKPCFLCLGFFKEDATIRAEKLVQLWIAQGLIPHEAVGRAETIEDIGRGYLDELINRSMVQVKDMSIDDRVKTCDIHDLIRELSITKAKEEINFEILREEGNSRSTHKARHRAMYCSQTRSVDFKTSADQNEHLRSLFIHGGGQFVHDRPSSYWRSFQLLRILDLEDCRFAKLPRAIGALIGLRYLGLRNTGVRKLPRSLGKLQSLLVLDIRNCDLTIPNVIWKIRSLRHLYGSAIRCDVHLRINTLNNIRTLRYVVLRDSNMEQVLRIASLCRLGINVERISSAIKLFASLAALESLVCLDLRDCGSLNMDGLSSLRRVTQLKLHGIISSLPSNFPPNLSSLSLVWTVLDEDPMPVLEKLPELLYLKLVKAYDGEEMVISHDGFPRLKRLGLEQSSSLRNIRVGRGGMLELRRLEIKSCPNLKIENLPAQLRSAAVTNTN